MSSVGWVAGAKAIDPEDGDLTSSIVTCPPESCAKFGCPGHEFSVKGISGCGVDVYARMGTVVTVEFVVWDLSIPAQRASATRQYVIVTPCETGEIYCPNLSAVCASTCY